MNHYVLKLISDLLNAIPFPRPHFPHSSRFQLLEEDIRTAAFEHGYPENKHNLNILDARFGYTPEEVKAVLTAWGPRGRRLYLTLQGMDAAFFIPAFVCIGPLVLLNRATAAVESRAPFLRPLALIPVFVAMCDWVENLGQSIATMSFRERKALPVWWNVAARVGCVGNMMKWGLSVVEGVVLLAAVGVMVWHLVRLALVGNVGKRRKGSHSE